MKNKLRDNILIASLVICIYLVVGCKNLNQVETVDTGTTSAEPVTTIAELVTSSTEPEITSAEPEITSTEPEITSTESVTEQTTEAKRVMIGEYVSSVKELKGGEDERITFDIAVDEEGFYDLIFTSKGEGGYKENYVLVDEQSVANLVSEGNKYTDYTIGRIYLEAGTHTVQVAKFWGYTVVDKLTVWTSEALDGQMYNVSASLVNKNASDNAKRLMSFLVDNYGDKIISGQYCDTGMYGKEFNVINKVTGKYPAILGLDFIEYSPSRVANGSKGHSTEYAKMFWEKGGIVTFCWHWNAPSKYLTGEWYSGFRTDATNIDLAKIMNGQDKEGYDLLMADIDAIANELVILRDAGVPILFRPLHEASGGWFWWGASGPESYKKLYILLFDRLTNEYGLNNLIWVWNGQDKDWYPGDEYVDIIGEDLYPGEHVYTSQVNKYLQAVDYTQVKKMVVMSENGCVFDPALAVRDGAMWGFFCTWQGEFVAKGTSIFTYSEQYTDKEMLKAAYESDVVITLDELPDLHNYSVTPERK